MFLKTAMWAHGLAAQAEYPVYSVEVKGWGKKFAFWKSNWFHIPFTTPAILEDARPKLGNVSVFYKTGGAAFINALHIYDGSKKVKAFDDIDVQGDHSESCDEFNTWVIDPPLEIQSGLGISVLVAINTIEAQPEEDTSPKEGELVGLVKTAKAPVSVLFNAAGAEFQVPGPDIQSGPGTDTLMPPLKLVRGMSRESSNGKYTLIFQADGNLVLYNNSNGSPVFATGTNAPSNINDYCQMDGDGNFFMWRQGMGNIWESGTKGHPGAFLRVEDDGKVAIIDPVNRIWRRPE